MLEYLKLWSGLKSKYENLDMSRIIELRIQGEHPTSEYNYLGCNIESAYFKVLQNWSIPYVEDVVLVCILKLEDESSHLENSKISYKPIDGLLFTSVRIPNPKGVYEDLMDIISKQVCLTLANWARQLGISTNLLWKTARILKKNQYYRSHTSMYKQKNGYRVHIEIRNEVSTQNFRLVLTLPKTQEKEVYHVCVKQYASGSPTTSLDYLQWLDEHLRTLNVLGWTHDSFFKMTWGDEIYIFDLCKRIILTPSLDASLPVP